MYLIFDTETTGKVDFNLPPEHETQPRLVQLGAQLLDSDFHVRAEMNMIVKPEGFTISDEVAKIHGITQAIADSYGLKESFVLQSFTSLCKYADVLVAHNLQFDGIVMGRAYHVRKVDSIVAPKKRCTMHEMTEVCKLPGRGGSYKWPSLQEAYSKVTNGETFEGAHDAMADVRACAKVFQYLVKGAVEEPPMKKVPEEAYNDTTPMPFGKNKGIPLGKVPQDYLLWLNTQRPLSNEHLNKYLQKRFPR